MDGAEKDQENQFTAIELMETNNDEYWEATTDASAHAVDSSPEPSNNEQEFDSLLAKFCTRMLPQFAFMQLPPDITSRQLRQRRPFLFRAIACVASPTSTLRIERSRAIKTIVCEALLSKGTHNSRPDDIDLLLGLLTYLAWGWDHLDDHCSTPRLMMHAVALACEIRGPVHGPECVRQGITKRLVPFHGNSESKERITNTAEFLERQRAILGCFLLSSAVSSYFGFVDSLRWTMREEESLAAISLNSSLPADRTFVLQVRLQCIEEKAVQAHRQLNVGQGQLMSETITFPTLASLDSLQEQLKDIQKTLSPSLLNLEVVVAHAHSTNLCINDMIYRVVANVSAIVTEVERRVREQPWQTLTGLSSGESTFTERLLCLEQCMSSSHACISTLLDMSPSVFTGISLLQWAKIVRCLIVLDHLAHESEDPIWNRPAARTSINLPSLLDRLTHRLDLAGQKATEFSDDNVFSQLAQTMRGISHDTKRSAEQDRREDTETDASWIQWRRHCRRGGEERDTCRH